MVGLLGLAHVRVACSLPATARKLAGGSGTANLTVMLNVKSAVSPSISVAVSAYVVLAFVSVGVPEITRVVPLKESPFGNVGASVYVRSPSPPLAAGKVTGVIVLYRR